MTGPALTQAWYHFEREVNNQLNALTASSRSPSETLVRLRAAQAAYFRSGLLLDVQVPPQALHGAAEFGSTFDADMADRLRGLCTAQLSRCCDTGSGIEPGAERPGDLAGWPGHFHRRGTRITRR